MYIPDRYIIVEKSSFEDLQLEVKSLKSRIYNKTKEQWIEEFGDTETEMLVELRNYLNEELKDYDQDEEYDALKDYIVEEYETCKNFRRKVNSEGVGYFYNDYTTVPCSYENYSNFIDSGECICGKCNEK